MDCVWAPWKSWSVCTKSCGGGTSTKNRTKSIIEAYGGTCLGNWTKTQACNEQECPGKLIFPPFVDLLYVIYCALILL